MDLDLKNESVFISGSSQGIGAAIAEQFLAAGARITLTGRDQQKLGSTQENLAGTYSTENIFTFRGDLTDSETISVALQETANQFGQINHVIVNLGRGISVPEVKIGEAEWERVFDLNFKSAVRLVETALPYLEATENSTITIIGSIAGLESLNAPIAYTTAKATLTAYSSDLARKLAASDIRVNCVAPGNVLFPGGSWEQKLKNNRAEIEDYIKTEVPMGRFGTPREIADVVVFLSSKRASFITGACVAVDGGQTRRLI